MNPTTVTPGEVLPAGVIDKAKVIAGLLSNLVTILTSSAVLALVPDQWDNTVLAVGAVVLLVVNTFAVYWTQPKVQQTVTIEGP